jgi:hypothetical protein
VAKALAQATATAVADVYTDCYGSLHAACNDRSDIDVTARAVSRVLNFHPKAEQSGSGGLSLPPLLHTLS